MSFPVTMTMPLLTFLLAAVSAPSFVHAQGGREFSTTPLNNDSLRQAVSYWTGSDHNKAEITALYGPIQTWDTSQVTSFNSLFKGATTFDEDLSAWNTSSVTDMADLFNGCTSMQGKPSLEGWDTSKVTTMARMFKSAEKWVGDLQFLDTSSVTDMSYMFQGATLFEGDGLDIWDVSQVQNFNFMFNRATNFNCDISSWNLESAEYMEGMFVSAVSFNQYVSDWDMTTLQSVGGMFEGAKAFNQVVCWETLQEGTNVDSMFCDAHAKAQLDPCCVVSESLITKSCCNGSCNTFCSPKPDSDTGLVSNDGLTDDSLVDQDLAGEDLDIDESTGIETNATVTGSTEGIDFGNTVVVSVQGDTSESSSDEQEEGSLWHRNVWVRIIVYVLILLVVGGIFLFILHTKTKRARPVAANTSVKNVAVKTKDEEAGEVETKPTEETNDEADASKPEEGSESKPADKAEKAAPPESPKK